jgi:hypothetical protein
MTESERQALVQAGLKSGAFLTQATIFDQPQQQARIVLCQGQRMVCLQRGGKVEALPIEEPGSYTFQPELLTDGAWPFVVFVIDAAHVTAWLALSDEAVDGVLTRCEAEVARTRGRMQ